MELYENIKALRKARGWSQQQLAESVGYGDRSSIAKIESGKVDLPRSKIAEFAKVFGVTPAYLLGYSEETYMLMNQIIEDNNSGRPAAVEQMCRVFGTEHSYRSARLCADKTKAAVVFYRAVDRRAAPELSALIETVEEMDYRELEKIRRLISAYCKASEPIREIIDTALKPYDEEANEEAQLG